MDLYIYTLQQSIYLSLPSFLILSEAHTSSCMLCLISLASLETGDRSMLDIDLWTTPLILRNAREEAGALHIMPSMDLN